MCAILPTWMSRALARYFSVKPASNGRFAYQDEKAAMALQRHIAAHSKLHLAIEVFYQKHGGRHR